MGGELVALQSVCYVSRDKEVVELSERYQPRGQISPSQESQKKNKKNMEVLGGQQQKNQQPLRAKMSGHPAVNYLFGWSI